MRLRNPEKLRLSIRWKGTSIRGLAKAIGKSPSFIDHLLSGRRHGCLPETAQAIAAALDVPVGYLFEDEGAAS